MTVAVGIVRSRSDAVVARVGRAVTVCIELVVTPRTLIARVADPVAITVGLRGVGYEWAVVTDISRTVLIGIELVIQEAKKQGLDKDPIVAEELRHMIVDGEAENP